MNAMRAAIILAALTSTVIAHADPNGPTGAALSTPAPRRTVDFVVRSTADEDPKPLEETIRELLSRLSLTVVPRDPKDVMPPGLLARVNVDTTSAAGVHVFVESAAGATLLDRTIPHDVNRSITHEQIASAVRGAIEAEILVDEDRVAGRAPPVVEPPATPTATEPPTPPPTPPPPPPAPAIATPPERDVGVATPSTPAFAVDIATMGGAGFFSSDVGPVVRVGGAIAVSSRRGLRPSLAVGVLYAFPFDADTRYIEAKGSLISVRALPSVELLHRSWFAVDVNAGGGVDVLRVEPASTILPASTFRSATTRVNPVLTGGVTGRVALASDVVATLSLLTDVELTNRQYVIEDRGAPVSVLSPGTVRPMLLAGFSFAAFGEPPFSSRAGKSP